MATILRGAEVAGALKTKLSEKAAALAAGGVIPTLCVIRVGERSDSIAYETAAAKRSESIGIRVVKHTMQENTSQDAMIELIDTVNKDPAIHGVLIFMPLPKHLDSDAIRAALSPEKDVDGITGSSVVSVFSGDQTGFAPCTARSCVEILDHFGIEIAGKHVVIIGRSLVIGRPLAMMLLSRNATVTMCHSATKDIPSFSRQADILVVAAGKSGLVDAKYLSPGQTVIDVGINVGDDGQLSGDVRYSDAEPIARAITPVPGGVGSVTTSVLAKHVLIAAEAAAKK